MIVVVLAALVSAKTPLNLTVILASSESKFMPVIFTIEPTMPITGLKPEINGVGITVKLIALITVTPLDITEIFPVDAPAGTLVVIVVEVDSVIRAVTPLNFTTFPDDVLKSVPVIITSAPIAPLTGLKSVMVGVGKIVKAVALVMVTPLTLTVMFPVVAATGTVTVMLVAVAATTTAVIPLN